MSNIIKIKRGLKQDLPNSSLETLGELRYATDTNELFIDNGSENKLINKDYIDASIKAHTDRVDNPHEVTKTQVGLGNVDNTSDLDKPISTATQSALNTKVDKTDEANQVYVTDGSGNQTHYLLSENALGSSFAYRSPNAQVRVNLTPSGNNDATSKKYVNDQDALKVDKTNESLKIYGTDELGNQVAYNKEEVGQIIQVEELPIADATNINKIYQYIGETNQNYTNGIFYKNVAMTTTEQWVSFEPSTIAGTVCTCSYEDFRAWLDTIFALDPLEVASGHFGFYSGTPDTGDARYSIGLRDAEGHSLKSISAEVSELEAAGFTFNPYLSAQDGLDYTCAVDKQVISYTWTPIYVQKKNIIFVDWGE